MRSAVDPTCSPPETRFALGSMLLTGGLLLALLSLGCALGESVAEQAREAEGAGGPAVEEEVELAIPMAHLQRHSAKLGFAIQGRNAPLADFYLAETEEALEGVREVESYEGYAIGRQVGVIMDPALTPLREALAREDWGAAREAYEVVIDACNRCHAATAHEFLVMEPVHGPAPYHQRFSTEPE